MTPADLLTQVGYALFGERWKADVARALKVSVDRVDDWSKQRGKPPPEVWLGLATLIQDREQVLPRLKLAVLDVGNQPFRRTYVATVGLKLCVLPDGDGRFPKVKFSNAAGCWSFLPEDVRILPAEATAFVLEFDGQTGPPTETRIEAIVHYPPNMKVARRPWK
jgi:hypothetical protein